MNAIPQNEYRALLRMDFYSFMVRCFAHLNGATEFLPNWHIEAMAGKLQGAVEGRSRRLIVNIPPRHLKSLAASVALPAWLLGRDPQCAIVNAAPWYKALFPTRLSSQRSPELATTAGGFRLATSVGGVLTGRGADVIIIDDPLKPSDAMSASRRAAVNDWFDATLYSRLDDKTRGIIILVMQRLHEDDLAGHVMKREGWDVASFAAIAEADERRIVETPFGARSFERLAGEALHPTRESLATLEEIRATIGAANFAGQYQQSPAPAGGGMIEAAWLRPYAPGELPARFDQVIQSWDTANKPTELADYSVCTTWGVRGAHLYLVNVLRKRLAYPDLKRAVCEQAETFGATTVLIEDKASGTQLIQELIEAGVSSVAGVKPDGDKIMRLHAQTATIENGFVHVPQSAPWLADYVGELTMFPKGRYDDQVDSTAQAIAWVKRRPPGWGMLEYYRRLSRAAGRGA